MSERRENNFGLMRLVLASVVALTHAYELSKIPELRLPAWLFSSQTAVRCFFVISGYLIVRSYEQSPSWQQYVRKRAARILPGYLTVIGGAAVGLSLVSESSVSEYFVSVGWFKYVLANALFLNFIAPTLPGVFSENPLSSAVNGALWTLKIEVAFYMAVPLLVHAGRRFGMRTILAVTYVASWLYAWGCSWWATKHSGPLFFELGRQLPGQLSYFCAGAAFHVEWPALRRHLAGLGLLGFLGLGVAGLFPLGLLEPAALAAATLALGLSPGISRVGNQADYSYGVYILHFPVWQLLLATGQWAQRPFAYLAVGFLVIAVLAVVLWHAVEAPVLRRAGRRTL